MFGQHTDLGSQGLKILRSLTERFGHAFRHVGLLVIIERSGKRRAPSTPRGRQSSRQLALLIARAASVGASSVTSSRTASRRAQGKPNQLGGVAVVLLEVRRLEGGAKIDIPQGVEVGDRKAVLVGDEEVEVGQLELPPVRKRGFGGAPLSVVR